MGDAPGWPAADDETMGATILPGPTRPAAAMMDAVNRQPTPAQRWLARLTFVLLGLAVAIVGVFAGLKSLVLLAAGLAGVAVSLAAA